MALGAAQFNIIASAEVPANTRRLYFVIIALCVGKNVTDYDCND
jgi:hypothetical protein